LTLFRFPLDGIKLYSVFPRKTLKMPPQSSNQRDLTEQNPAQVSHPKNTERTENEDLSEVVSSGAVKPAPVEKGSTKAATYSNSSPPSSKKHIIGAEDNDSDPEYESVKILKGHPSLRDPSELPIIAKHAVSGERKILWAKMDTGADVNVIAAKVVERLGLQSKITTSNLDLREIGGNDVQIDRKVTLSFWAGRKNAYCQDVEFVIPVEAEDTDTDGLPDVLLGFPELRKRHMIMIDPDFCNDPEEGLEVIAKRACEEIEGEAPPSIFLGTKYPQIKR
jgi:hypothetical protein